jgi:HD-GYP domain-containing protein (c-di-GMP phosphodiesterase class II)
MCADAEEILGGLDSVGTWEAVIDAERAVADLAGEAGARLGLADGGTRTLRWAGLVHDFGRLGVSNSIWDKRGPLGSGEWERVRLHPYLTERILQQSEALAPLGRIAVQHRERLDGSGYPRGLAGAAFERGRERLGLREVARHDLTARFQEGRTV